MEEDKIKDLFGSFEPELSPSVQFMNKLQRTMEAVEIVKQHNLALKKRNRLAVIIAAACGVAAGVMSTLLFPLVGDWISTFSLCSMAIDYKFLAWILLAAVSGVTTLNAYEIALAKLAPAETIA